MRIDEQTRLKLLPFQRNEITEQRIYTRLAQEAASPPNQQVLLRIAEEERQHYEFWKTYTGQDVAPDSFKVWKYYLISRLLGFTFGAKLMENGEGDAQANYAGVRGIIPDVEALIEAEHQHENSIIDLLDEEALRYTGSVVLGLNDALVELAGVLTGLTFALQNTQLIALSGSITGIAAALSMAASEYLSTKAEGRARDASRAALYTGVAYIVTVIIMILPYLLVPNLYVCLALALAAAIAIIAAFNYYIAVVKDLNFKARFLEMAALSFGVAGLTFLIGLAIRLLLGVNI
jgi:VIT1/CCC1 family predicted Fe2+/Mn2+ transporter